MSRTRAVRTLAATAVAAATALSAPAAAAAASGGCASAATQRHLAAAVATAKGRYALEATGAAAHAALAGVAADRTLGDAVRAGNRAAAAAEAARLVAGHMHITAIRVLRGGRVVVATKRYPFDVAGPQTALRDRRGAVVGTVELTIQDVIGFIRLVHKYTGAAVVVRGAGETKSSLAAARTVALPAGGCATVAGRSYAVRSFGETGFGGEQLTVWILKSS